MASDFPWSITVVIEGNRSFTWHAILSGVEKFI